MGVLIPRNARPGVAVWQARAMRLASLALVGLLSVPALAAASEGGEHEHLTPTALFHNLQFWGAVVNFALLAFLIRKMSKQPLGKFLEQRRQEVEQGMKEAAELKAKAEAVYNEYNDRLKTMDTDIEKLREDIRKAAEADKQRILADAEAASKRLRAETEALITQHGDALAREVRSEVVEAAVLAAQDVLRGNLTADDQKRLAERYKQSLATGGGQA